MQELPQSPPASPSLRRQTPSPLPVLPSLPPLDKAEVREALRSERERLCDHKAHPHGLYIGLNQYGFRENGERLTSFGLLRILDHEQWEALCASLVETQMHPPVKLPTREGDTNAGYETMFEHPDPFLNGSKAQIVVTHWGMTHVTPKGETVDDPRKGLVCAALTNTTYDAPYLYIWSNVRVAKYHNAAVQRERFGEADAAPAPSPVRKEDDRELFSGMRKGFFATTNKTTKRNVGTPGDNARSGGEDTSPEPGPPPPRVPRPASIAEEKEEENQDEEQQQQRPLPLPKSLTPGSSTYAPSREAALSELSLAWPSEADNDGATTYGGCDVATGKDVVVDTGFMLPPSLSEAQEAEAAQRRKASYIPAHVQRDIALMHISEEELERASAVGDDVVDALIEHKIKTMYIED